MCFFFKLSLQSDLTNRFWLVEFHMECSNIRTLFFSIRLNQIVLIDDCKSIKDVCISLLIYYFSNPRGAARSCGPLFDLEVFYFLVSIKKLEGSPCSSLSDRTLFQSPNPLFFFSDRTRPEKREDRAPTYSNVPIVAALHGLATGVSVSALVLRLSLSLSLSVRVHCLRLSLSLCLCASALCYLSHILSILKY